MTMTIEQLAALAAKNEDQTQVTKGGDFEREIPEAGTTVGRLIEYIELGKQPQKPYQGKPKPPAEVVIVTFELLHPKKNIKEIEVDGEKRKIADRIRLTVTKKLGEKARFKKLFNKLQYGRADKAHIAQMLGEPFILDIYHNQNEDKTKTYANVEKDGEYTIRAAIKPADPMDENSKPTPINVPAALSPIKLFIWDIPNKETWDSLFIDGTHTRKDEKGNETEHSNNWIQERILSATNYAGSPLEALLNEVSDLKIEEPSKTTSKAEEALGELEASKAATTGPATTDELDSLGLS